eukprot:g79996.t1
MDTQAPSKKRKNASQSKQEGQCKASEVKSASFGQRKHGAGDKSQEKKGKHHARLASAPAPHAALKSKASMSPASTTRPQIKEATLANKGLSTDSTQTKKQTKKRMKEKKKNSNENGETQQEDATRGATLESGDEVRAGAAAQQDQSRAAAASSKKKKSKNARQTQQDAGQGSASQRDETKPSKVLDKAVSTDAIRKKKKHKRGPDESPQEAVNAEYRPGDLLLLLNPEVSLPEDVQAAREQASQPTAGPVPEDKPEVATGEATTDQIVEEAEAQETREERDKRTIFIGNVPVNVKTKDLRALFLEFGQVESVRLRSISYSNPKLPRKAAFAKKAFHEGRDSCNAYLVFKSESSVQPALSKNGAELGGKVLRVDYATPHASNHSVFVGNLPFNVKEDELREFFEDCGTITNVRCVRDSRFNIGKGIAFVSFDDAEGVRRAVTRNEAQFGTRSLRVFKAKKPDNQSFKHAVRAQRRISGKVKKEHVGESASHVIGERKEQGEVSDLLSFQSTQGKRKRQAEGSEGLGFNDLERLAAAQPASAQNSYMYYGKSSLRGNCGVFGGHGEVNNVIPGSLPTLRRLGSPRTLNTEDHFEVKS